MLYTMFVVYYVCRNQTTTTPIYVGGDPWTNASSTYLIMIPGQSPKDGDNRFHDMNITIKDAQNIESRRDVWRHAAIKDVDGYDIIQTTDGDWRYMYSGARVPSANIPEWVKRWL